MREPRKYLGLVIPVGFVMWRLWSLGFTSLETLQRQPTTGAAAHLKAAIMWEMWAAVLALVLLMGVFERAPLASIGFGKPDWGDVAWVPVVMIASVLAELVWAEGFVLASGYSLAKFPHPSPAYAVPLRVRVLMFLTEPVFEETVYRGYLIERLDALSGSTAAAVGISALASSLMHGGWTLGLFILPLGLGSAVLYGWRRNLPACLVLHALWMIPTLAGRSGSLRGAL